MKKLMSLLISAITMSLIFVSPLQTSALDFDEKLIDHISWRYHNDTFTLDTDSFQYTANAAYRGKILQTTLPMFRENGTSFFLVSGFWDLEDGSQGAILTSINVENGDRGLIGAVPSDFDTTTLKIGDVICGTIRASAIETIPTMYDFEEIENLGSGEAIFGKEFRKVIRHEYITNKTAVSSDDPSVSVFDFQDGDVTEDDTLDIMDVIRVNRYLLGSRSLDCCYQEIVADVNKDGKIDSTDSLMILKEIVEITKGFVEQ